MVANLKTILRMLKAYGTLDLLWFLRDTKYCLLHIIADAICAASAIAGVFLLSTRFGGFGGMTENEILFMIGYATLVDGIFMILFVGGNTGKISRVIGRGQLDHNMIQPVPLWIQLLTEGFAPVSGNSMLISGIALTIYSLFRINIELTPLWIIILVISLISSCVIIISVIYIISCLAFYAPAAAEEIAEVTNDLFVTLKVYPLGGLSSAWQTILCSVIPIGLAAWFPSKVLLNQTPDTFLGGIRFPALTIAVAAVFLFIAVTTFKKGMSYYAKFGSPRYTGFGHR